MFVYYDVSKNMSKNKYFIGTYPTITKVFQSFMKESLAGSAIDENVYVCCCINKTTNEFKIYYIFVGKIIIYIVDTIGSIYYRFLKKIIIPRKNIIKR